MSKPKPLTLLFFIYSFLFFSFPLSAQDVATRRVEDDSYLRAALLEPWFRENPVDVMFKPPELYNLRGGSQVQVRVETSARNPDEFAVVLARGQSGSFSSWNQGSWSLIRRMDNDLSGQRIRYFPRTDFNLYVEFRPFNDERSFMDVIIYDAVFVRSLSLPVSFERLLVMPVEDALALVESRLPRHYFDPYPGAYRESMDLIAAIRPQLRDLAFVDDGALNENNEYVYINTLRPQNLSAQGGRGGLNCSGFVKWVIDGILRPQTGQRLPIAPLKEPFGERGTSYTDIWEDLRDPFFGLDWNRNLASTAGAVLRSPSFSTLEEIEVRHMPFSQVINRRPTGDEWLIMQPSYAQNAGYPMEALYPLLYTLAIDEPGHIYLAAVNNEIGLPTTQDNLRGIPRMRQFYHVAVLIPFFNERGTFQVAVFESAAETSITAFISRYPGESVNLVRVPVEGRFDP